MGNDNALNYWSKMANSNPSEKTIKVVNVNDFTQIDADFIMKYANKSTSILDIASGTGLTINKIYDKVKHISAIEAFEEFSKFIKRTNKISIINTDIQTFQTHEKFDIITMFGIVSYFNENEIKSIYQKYAGFLAKSGKLIIKNQFGIKGDVIIDGFSDELKTFYYSEYRYIKKEISILNSIGLKDIEVIDIYPPECNRWENTHFYAIISNI